MAVSWLALCLAPIPAYLLYTWYCLWRQYRIARNLKLPFIIVPFSVDSPLWVAIQLTCKTFRENFPWEIANFTYYLRMDWEFHDRYRTHQRLGRAFTLVTPTRNWIFIADPQAVGDILVRGKDFTRPVWILQHLDVFGPSIATAEGTDWQRQRKLTAAPFGEGKSVQVWLETIKQATAMLDKWCTNPVTSTADDVRTLALHVLAFAAFHKSYPFDSISRESSGEMTYRDALGLILRNTFVILVMGQKVLSSSIVPQSWQNIGRAMNFFRKFAYEQIDAEREAINCGQPESGTLVSNLVRASVESAKDARGLKPLTADEVLSNVFIYNFAGHDTTASSLAYTVILLAANPQVQDWLYQEIRHYVDEKADIADLSYEELFPKLKRLLTVLYETIRLFPPLPSQPRYTGDQARPLTIDGKMYMIPPDTIVSPAIQCSQTNPEIWGSDSLVWRPQRWITTSEAGGGLETESMITAPRGTYYPWSEGVRNCPGKKFSQVESTAVLLTLLRSHVAEPVLKVGESPEAGRQRLLRVVANSHVHLLLEMKRPEEAAIRWRRRTEKCRA